MARDRLAAMRAQQQGGGGYRPEPSYPSQGGGQYELSNVGGRNGGYGNGGGAGGMAAFYDEVSSFEDALRQYNANVNEIAELHNRSLDTIDPSVAQRNASQLESLLSRTSTLSSELKSRLQSLAKQPSAPEDVRARQNQIDRLRENFKAAVQNYQKVEQQYRHRQEQRIERQFRIVKPNATQEEVRAVVDDQRGDQVFTQALMESNRYGESRAAYKEVQERHADIKKIERTMAELAQLFNDLNFITMQQDDVINNIQTQAEQAHHDMEQGLHQTELAVKSARSARKKRWICFCIIMTILIIVGLVLGIYFGVVNKK